MKIAIIGRTEILYGTAILLKASGFDVTCILTAKEAPEYKCTAADFKKLAAEWRIPYSNGSRIDEHFDFLRASNSDVALSINYPGIIPSEIISLFPLGILNAHGGDLPRYRGNACQAWAILNGEAQIGLCIHKMVGGELDSGDIISRDYLPINHKTKVTEAWEWLRTRTPTLMLEAVNRIGKDRHYILESQSRRTVDSVRCYPRRPEDGRIIWEHTAINVLRLVNASNKPYAGAFCEFEGRKLVIWDAELVEDEEVFCAVPGQVTRIGNNFIDVACGEGKLRLLCVEIDQHVINPADLIKSIRLRLA